MRTSLRILAATVTLFALSCSNTTEPGHEPEGRISLRFEQAPAASMSTRDGVRGVASSAVIDSVVLRVFRPGNPVTQETFRAVPVTGPIVDITIPCIAENGKRVSVDLYEGGQFTYHGFTTGVNVVKGAQTPVSIDAYDFTIANLSVTPSPLATAPEPFDLTWSAATAAMSYDVQASATADFGTIAWEQSITDTVTTADGLAPGGYYFRVVPRTPYAYGSSCPEQFAYMQSASQDVIITSFSVPAAKPVDVITIYGENFDYPGTQVTIGSMQMQILSVSWGEMDVRIPRAAISEGITVANGIGSDTKDFVVQRVAYVTSGGSFTDGYITALEKHNDDFGFSGVAVVRLPELDTQDMSVFDIIVVAGDTGTSPSNWGGDPDRANRIHDTTANVLAMGRGGAVFLVLVGATTAAHGTATDTDGAYYAPNGSDAIFSTPHSVGGGSIKFTSENNASTTDFSISSAAKPAGVTLYASTDCARSLGICLLGQPNDRWVLADFNIVNTGGDSVHYFFWGYADDPEELTSAASDVLGNIMYQLYRNRVVTPVAN